MTTTPQAALLREAAQNALITLDGIANANPRDKTDFDTPDEWIAWAKSRARWAADALREPVAQEVYAERILKQMLHEDSKATQAEPPKDVSMPQYWSVDVFSDGAKIVSIGNDWLSGERPLDEIDERTIIGAAQHLLSFVGYGLPPTSFDPDAQAEPAQAGSASLLDGCKSIMDSIAVSSSVIEHNRQEPVQAEPTLRDYADSLIKAGHDFWKACRREAGGGAVRWLSCDDGTLVVFTRGEYRDTIMENIGCYKAPEVFFEEDGITAAESKEPVQAGELPPLPEPDSFLFQHDETGNTMFVDAQQVEWGFEKNNPRLHKIGGAFTERQMHAYARAALAARKPMTDEQIDALRIKSTNAMQALADRGLIPAPEVCDEDLVRRVERAHGIGLEVKP